MLSRFAARVDSFIVVTSFQINYPCALNAIDLKPNSDYDSFKISSRFFVFYFQRFVCFFFTMIFFFLNAVVVIYTEIVVPQKSTFFTDNRIAFRGNLNF